MPCRNVLPEQVDFFSGFADAAYTNADEGRTTNRYVFMTSRLKCAIRGRARSVWLRNLYTELGLLKEDMPTTIRGDNEGSIAMAKNPQFHIRTKHIAVRWHWIRELVQDGTITVESYRDLEQIADILTKPLPRPKNIKHVEEKGLAPT